MPPCSLTLPLETFGSKDVNIHDICVGVLCCVLLPDWSLLIKKVVESGFCMWGQSLVYIKYLCQSETETHSES